MSDREYYDLVNNVAYRAAKLGYYVIGHGEIELKDRTFHLESKIVTTLKSPSGSLDVIASFLTNLERDDG